MIKKCEDCPGNKWGTNGAKFQDEKYGKNMRVFVETNNGERCTVCYKEKLKAIKK